MTLYRVNLNNDLKESEKGFTMSKKFFKKTLKITILMILISFVSFSIGNGFSSIKAIDEGKQYLMNAFGIESDESVIDNEFLLKLKAY